MTRPSRESCARDPGCVGVIVTESIVGGRRTLVVAACPDLAHRRRHHRRSVVCLNGQHTCCTRCGAVYPTGHRHACGEGVGPRLRSEPEVLL